MTDFTFTLLRLGFLVLLWVFVLSAIGVLRRDLHDPRTPARRRRGKSAAVAAAPAPRAAATPPPATEPHPTPKTAPPPPRRQEPTGPTQLVVISGPLRGTTLPLTTSAILIGRAPSCTLVLDDGYSSSRHARIFPQNGTWYVEDLGSTNGTFVGEQRIEGVVALGPTTPVRIGQSVVELQR
jgi:pSer/pThr/pTyr-binding forkhead associated (FHA) protein